MTRRTPANIVAAVPQPFLNQRSGVPALEVGTHEWDNDRPYEAYEVTAYLRQDGQRLRHLLGLERAAQEGLRLA